MTKTTLLQLMSVMTLVMVITLGQTNDVFADPTIRLTQGINFVEISDQGVDDTNNNTGIVQYTQGIGVFDNVLAATSTSNLNATNPSLNTAIIVQSTAGGNLTYAFSDGNFTGTDLTCVNFGGGTTDGDVTHTVYVDSSNGLFATTTPIFSTTSFPDGQILIDKSANATGSSLYSLTIVSEIAHNIDTDRTSFSIITSCDGEETPTWNATTDSNPQGDIDAPVDNPVDTVNIIADA
ncbi:MAG: hypothetical protein OEQ12_04300, partial [Nitrosopumilus sp.]|nr:hypothetical protein [Nitrosopumilus sp.]